jgi:hypothetical protein
MDHERRRSVGIGHPGREPKAYTTLMEELLMMQVLTDAELDAVSGGHARARLGIASLLALGSTSATADAAGVNVLALTEGGLDIASVSGTFTATSSSASAAAETDV